MGKSRTATAASSSKTSNHSSPNKQHQQKDQTNSSSSTTTAPPPAPLPTGGNKKKLPNVASAGIAFLVAGGYTPLPLSSNGFESSSFGSSTTLKNSSSAPPPPFTEMGTSWATRWESCQMMREQHLMTTTGAAGKNSGNTNSDEKTKDSSSIKSLGETKVNWQLLLKLRNWVVRVLNSSHNGNSNNNNKNTKEAIRCLLLGVPFASSVLMDDNLSLEKESEVDGNGFVKLVIEDEKDEQEISQEKSQSRKDQNQDDAAEQLPEDTTTTKSPPTSNRKQQQSISDAEYRKTMELISTTNDWNVLVEAARKQVTNVMDPFLKKHFVVGGGEEENVRLD